MGAPFPTTMTVRPPTAAAASSHPRTAPHANPALHPRAPPAGVQIMDGSIQADVPTQRLAELFHVNNCIVSQVNPHVVPFVHEGATSQESGIRSLLDKAEFFLNLDMQQRCKTLAKLRLLPKVRAPAVPVRRTQRASPSDVGSADVRARCTRRVPAAIRGQRYHHAARGPAGQLQGDRAPRRGS